MRSGQVSLDDVCIIHQRYSRHAHDDWCVATVDGTYCDVTASRRQLARVRVPSKRSEATTSPSDITAVSLTGTHTAELMLYRWTARATSTGMPLLQQFRHKVVSLLVGVDRHTANYGQSMGSHLCTDTLS